MIRNLNQVTFQGFGTVPPERSQGNKNFDKASATLWNLSQSEPTIYQAQGETWLMGNSGMSVLSVGTSADSFQHYYLDKPVCIKDGVLFSLSPFMGEASVLMYAPNAPEPVGKRASDTLRVDHQLRVECIYTFFYQEKEQGFLFSGESHPMAELTYVDQGALHSVADGQDLLLKQGDLVIYGPNQWHMQYADPGEAPRLVSAVFSTASSLAPLCNRKIQPGQEAAGLLRRMLWEQENPDEYAQDMLLSLLTTLLLLLLRQTRQTQETAQSAVTLNRENMRIRRVQQYVSDHVQEKLSVPTVAKGCQLSPSYMTALFQKHLHISPAEYIRRIKLQYSKQLIREGNMNITQIAKALEYSTIHHFSRQFKDKFGITPSEYAKSLKETTGRD